MNSRERILKTIRGEIPDRVPMYDFLFQKEIYRALLNRECENYNVIDVIDVSRELHLDLADSKIDTAKGFETRYINENQYIDEWGTTYQKDEAAWPTDAPVAYPIQTYDDFKAYTFPDPTDAARYSGIQKGLEYANGEIAVTAGGNGPFTQAWMLMGPEELFINTMLEPEFIKALLRETTNYFIEVVKQLKKVGVDFITIAEDLGDSNQGFLRLDVFREIVLPELQRVMDAAAGTPVFFHSCGNINEYLDDIVDLGIAILHPMQRTAHMSLKEIKEKYGARVTLCGNVDSSRTLPYGTPEDVRKEAQECLDIAKKGGRFILASDHSLHDGISIENIKALFQTGLENGSY